MKRVKRQPSRFGAVDLADQVAREFNLPLERLSEKFSFDEATTRARADRALMNGRRTERMFEYVVAALGKADLITSEDSAAPLSSGVEVQAPDYFVSLKSGQKFFVEVKHMRAETFSAPMTFSQAYLSRLKHYARLKGHPLLIAVYWNNLSIWTINKIEDVETANGTINLRFVDAYRKSVAGEFGDRMVAAVPPLACRIHADPARPSFLRDDDQASFTISKLSFFSEHKEIVKEQERLIAFYLMFHSRWEHEMPVAMMDGQRVEYVEITAKQFGAAESGQEFESLGTLAGMVSSYYNWLTTADGAIVRLTPQLEPDQLAPEFDHMYQGEVLRLWQFQMLPNIDPVTPG